MKWKPLMAVLIGLLMVGVTAGSASAIATISNDHHAPPSGEGIFVVHP